ncbi:MAG TPA: sugar phosphate nucleotidyltransferase [Vicinamibacterales bacterium]|nr:sugar phosphate nucleotidyltransferase [Vicinamibacterales bacterium]
MTAVPAPVLLPALVLTAGLATRLRPLSLIRAKAALPVAGEPLASRVIRVLAGHGVRDIVLNLHHRPETLTRAVGDGADLGVRVRYSWENPVLGSAGGPRHALPLLDAPRFLIVNGDTLTDVDIAALAAAHEQSGALVTMALIPNPHPERYGGVLLDEDRVAGFVPRHAGAVNHHFVGVQIAETAAFAGLPDNVPSESVRDLYPRLLREAPGSVRAFVSRASFADIGTPRDYFETSLAMAAREGKPDNQAGRGARIAATARVSRSIVWDDVTVEGGAALTECIVVDGVRVPAGVELDRSIVLPAAAESLGAEGHRRDNLLIAPF